VQQDTCFIWGLYLLLHGAWLVAVGGAEVVLPPFWVVFGQSAIGSGTVELDIETATGQQDGR
jgi:hypothetical protein